MLHHIQVFRSQRLPVDHPPQRDVPGPRAGDRISAELDRSAVRGPAYPGGGQL